MKTAILIKDCTLKNCETDKALNISFKEKLEIARQLENINTDIIETGFADTSQGAFIAVKTIASNLKKSILCCPAQAFKASIDKTYEAIKGAVRPRIHISLPVSSVNMEYQLHMKKNQVVETVKQTISYAKTLFSDVEFTALDATRSDMDFLIEVINTAADAGATTIGVEDSVGHMLPDEINTFLTDLIKSVGRKNIAFSFRAKNELGMAVANTLSAIKAGVNQITCAINGTANDASLEETVSAIHTRQDAMNAQCNMLIAQLNRASVLLSGITDIKNGKPGGVIGASLLISESDLLDKEMDFYSFRTFVEGLGYTLTEKDIERIYDMFKELCAKKQQVYTKDIEAIIGREAVQVPRVYRLDRFVINSGNNITSTALIRLQYYDKPLEGVGMGDGPIDAAFHVIEQIMGMNIELFDFNLKSVTEGKDALGAATVKIRYNGKIHVGRGLSTDVIESSILAYINAVNKMLFEEGIQ
ncbi:MAG TPA: alpha-isopropylmalate synthase regulatory domain-containing protein [Clostridia bacterium]|nr:alpha-isopropylmalate synthase regulatory domain-containing protein [Clostridia bacterium]HQC69209.1 alpha-isopropylmalate synthase regulatory domain-containing protein [Clostridia bacterium]